jgi:hypothetical protein
VTFSPWVPDSYVQLPIEYSLLMLQQSHKLKMSKRNSQAPYKATSPLSPVMSPLMSYNITTWVKIQSSVTKPLPLPCSQLPSLTHSIVLCNRPCFRSSHSFQLLFLISRPHFSLLMDSGTVFCLLFLLQILLSLSNTFLPLSQIGHETYQSIVRYPWCW